MKKTKLRNTSVIIAQVFMEYMEGYDFDQKKEIGENIIKFMYKYLYNDNEEDELSALMDFYNHNKDCRFECYCCSGLEECVGKDYGEQDGENPNYKDEYIQNIICILKTENNEYDINTDECDVDEDFFEEQIN